MCVYAEVEILVASNLGSIHWQEMSRCFIICLFKITTHKMRSFEDVFSFSKDVENNMKREWLWIMPVHSYAHARPTTLVCVFTIIPAFWRGQECITWAVWLPRHHSWVHRMKSHGVFILALPAYIKFIWQKNSWFCRTQMGKIFRF